MAKTFSSGSVQTRSESRAEYRFRSSQGTTPGGVNDPGAPLWMPQLVTPGGLDAAGARQAVMTTAYDFFIDYVPDGAYDLNQNPNADAVLFTHPQISYCRNLLSFNVSRQPESWHVGTDDSVPLSVRKEMAYVAQSTWESIPNIMHLYDIWMRAVVEGGIGTEFIWERENDKTWVPKHFFPVHKTQFVRNINGYMFLVTRETIPFGAGISGNPSTMPADWPKDEKLIPLNGLPGKWLYHVYRYDTGPYYRTPDWGFMYWGRGEGNSLYRIVTVDNSVLDLRLKLLQTFAIPPLLLYYPERAESIRSFQNILSSMRRQSVIRLPRRADRPYDGQYKVEALNREMGSYDALDNYYRLYTTPAIRSIMTLDPSMGGDSMSYSERAETNETGFDSTIDWHCQTMCNTINYQFVPAMIRAHAKWRTAPMGAMPRLRKASERARHKLNLIELYDKGASNVPIPQEVFYRAMGVTPTKECEKIMSEPVYHPENAVDAHPVDAIHDEQERIDHAGREPKPRNEARSKRAGVNDVADKKRKSREQKELSLASALADYYAIPPADRNSQI